LRLAIIENESMIENEISEDESLENNRNNTILLKTARLKSYVKEAVLTEKIQKQLFDDEKVFVNDLEKINTIQVELMLLQRPLTLRRLKNCPMLFLNPLPKKVNILMSTGNGHYPSYFGFIGHGMLTGVVYGELFKFPPSNFILASIRALTKTEVTNGGCLLIVRNYLENRLNCGMACEQGRLK